MWLFTNLAMALDTLPVMGRVFLLALLLACALYGFTRLVGDSEHHRLVLMYSKAALCALIGVPVGVLLFDVQVPVPVEEYRRYATSWPAYITYGVLLVWALGALVQLGRLAFELRATMAAARAHDVAGGKLGARLEHWSRRLNLPFQVTLRCGGAELPWHTGSLAAERPHAGIVLPAAARNWPPGIVDVLLLTQLAQLQQNSWRWLIAGRAVGAVYWFAPWVHAIYICGARTAQSRSLTLAAAAYRDKEGWRRDARSASQRCGTLQSVALNHKGAPLRLGSDADFDLPPAPTRQRPTVDASFEEKLAATKRRYRAKRRDPYEQAYWLIAAASILIAITTTLTLRPAAPEFEPGHLNIRWQDQMVRRLRDDGGTAYEHAADQAPAEAE